MEINLPRRQRIPAFLNQTLEEVSSQIQRTRANITLLLQLLWQEFAVTSNSKCNIFFSFAIAPWNNLLKHTPHVCNTLWAHPASSYLQEQVDVEDSVCFQVAGVSICYQISA